MAAAGLNLIGTVYDYKYNLGEGDDNTGGSQPSGTMLQENVQLRIAAMKPTQAILEQGVETTSLYSGFIGNYTVEILNNHEIEITAPASSIHYGKRYRILGNPQKSSTHPSDSRSFLLVMMKRVDKSRSIQ